MAVEAAFYAAHRADFGGPGAPCVPARQAGAPAGPARGWLEDFDDPALAGLFEQVRTRHAGVKPLPP